MDKHEAEYVEHSKEKLFTPLVKPSYCMRWPIVCLRSLSKEIFLKIEALRAGNFRIMQSHFS